MQSFLEFSSTHHTDYVALAQEVERMAQAEVWGDCVCSSAHTVGDSGDSVHVSKVLL